MYPLIENILIRKRLILQDAQIKLDQADSDILNIQKFCNHVWEYHSCYEDSSYICCLCGKDRKNIKNEKGILK